MLGCSILGNLSVCWVHDLFYNIRQFFAQFVSMNFVLQSSQQFRTRSSISRTLSGYVRKCGWLHMFMNIFIRNLIPKSVIRFSQLAWFLTKSRLNANSEEPKSNISARISCEIFHSTSSRLHSSSLLSTLNHQSSQTNV